MAWPESLTVDQQQNVIDFANSCRSWAAMNTRLNILSAAIAAAWSGGISTLVGSLQAADQIPNTSGLAVAQDLQQADVSNLANWATAHCSTTNADQGTGSFNSGLIQAVCIKAAGINGNSIG